MTGITTGQTSLPTCTDSDDTEHFLTVDLVTAEQALANLFDSSTGHAHDGSGKGAPITTAGISNGAVTPAKMSATAFSTFTPTLNQNGALTTSAATGHYLQLGKLVVAHVHLIASSGGTGGVQVIVGGLPVASAAVGPACHGYFVHSGGPIYLLEGIWASSTTVNLYASNAGGAAPTGLWGVSPGTAIVSGDTIDLTFVYEAT